MEADREHRYSCLQRCSPETGHSCHYSCPGTTIAVPVINSAWGSEVKSRPPRLCDRLLPTVARAHRCGKSSETLDTGARLSRYKWASGDRSKNTARGNAPSVHLAYSEQRCIDEVTGLRGCNP